MTLHTLGVAFNIALLGFAAYMVALFIYEYRLQPTGASMWRKVMLAAYDSGTILWAKFCVILSALTSQLDSLCDMLGMPELKDFINQWVGNPKAISAIMLAITAITYTVRMRKGSSDPVR